MSNGTETNKLKNDFREELAKKQDPIKFEADRVGEEEMLRRDQYVSMRQLEVQEQMMAADLAHTKMAIEKYGEFLEELNSLPLSEGRGGVINMIMKQIESLQRQQERSVFPRVNKVTLDALQKVFKVTEIATSSATGEISVDKAEPGKDRSVSTELQDKTEISDNDDDELTAPETDLEEEAI